MWRTSTRVLRSTACLLAVLCFVFLRTSALAAQDTESSVKGCSEIFNVCISEAPSVLLEGKPHKVSKIDSCLGERVNFTLFDPAGCKTMQAQGFVPVRVIANQRPRWLINQALLI